MRVGTGYDVHRLAEGRKLVLGGVAIPMREGWRGIRMQMCFCMP